MLPSILEEYSSLEPNKEESTLFVDYIRNWLEHKKSEVQLSTWEGYEIYIRCHIIPYFEPLGLQISEVTPKHIQEYLESRLICKRSDHKTCGLLPISIKKQLTVLNQVFRRALLDDLIRSDPMNLIIIPKQEKREPAGKFLTVEEANRLLQAFNGHEIQSVIYVTLYYGMRRSEVLGLKWDAVDFENNTIRIKHTVVKQSTIIAKDLTKSLKSRRTYPLLPEVKELLLRQKEKQRQGRIDFGADYKENDYIFTWSDGTPYRPDYITKSFGNVLERHHLPHLRFHDLRHSTASILYDKNWEMKDIQEWLGHADISTTANIYTHISELRKEKIGNDLSGTFKL